MIAQRSMSVLSPTSRLAALGFRHDPFAFYEAEKMPSEVLEEILVPHPGFDDLMNFYRSTVLLVPHGGGKTANRLRLEAYLNKRRDATFTVGSTEEGTPYTPLVINYSDFESISRHLPAIDLKEHIQPLLAATAETIFTFIISYPERFMALDTVARTWWWIFLKMYLHGMALNYRVRANPLADDLRRVVDSSAPFHPDSSLEQIMKSVRDACIELGFDSLYILVDGVDSAFQNQDSSYKEALIAPLLNSLAVLSLSSVIWKFFLPSTLEEIVKRSSGFQTGRLSLKFIRWDEISLRDLLRRRLEWASDSQWQALAQICDDQLQEHVDVDQRLARMALRHRHLGPPCALLELGRQLLQPRSEKSDERPSIDIWNDFRKSTVQDLIPYLFISYAEEDQEFVERLARDLQAHGLWVWLDRQEMQVGDSIIQRINQGIEESDHLIIVLSPASLRSALVQAELNVGVMQQFGKQVVRVLPVLLRECEIPPLLSDRIYADFRFDYAQGMSQLLIALQ